MVSGCAVALALWWSTRSKVRIRLTSDLYDVAVTPKKQTRSATLRISGSNCLCVAIEPNGGTSHMHRARERIRFDSRSFRLAWPLSQTAVVGFLFRFGVMQVHTWLQSQGRMTLCHCASCTSLPFLRHSFFTLTPKNGFSQVSECIPARSLRHPPNTPPALWAVFF